MNERPDFSHTPLSRAYTRQLEQLSDQAFWQLATEAANAKLPARDNTPAADEALVCLLAQGRCLLPLAFLREVVSPPYHFTLFPTTPPWMPGTYAWRGNVVAVADLHAYLTDSTTRVPAGRIEARHGILLIMQHEGITLGLLVATVESTTSLHADNMKPLDQARIPAAHTDVIKGIQTVQVIQSRPDAEQVRRSEEEALVLDVLRILRDMVQQIKL